MSTTTTILLTTTSAGWVASAGYAMHLFRRVHTDPLTGLPNRDLLTVLARRARGRGRVGLLLLDIDRFKSINDVHGHRLGDEVLRAFAAELTRAAEPGEMPIRLHGDEFALWLGSTTQQDADERARQVTERLHHTLDFTSGLRLAVSASVGAHTLPAAHFSLSALLAGADAAMYAAKRGTRLTSLPTITGRLRDQPADTSGKESA